MLNTLGQSLYYQNSFKLYRKLFLRKLNSLATIFHMYVVNNYVPY